MIGISSIFVKDKTFCFVVIPESSISGPAPVTSTILVDRKELSFYADSLVRITENSAATCAKGCIIIPGEENRAFGATHENYQWPDGIIKTEIAGLVEYHNKISEIVIIEIARSCVDDYIWIRSFIGVPGDGFFLCIAGI